MFDKIKNEIETNDVVIFMKGTKDFPQCGFSATVVQIFERIGLDFKDINILPDPELRESIKKFSDWPTIPQIYIKGEFVGGCDILKELYASGELEELLMNKGLITAE